MVGSSVTMTTYCPSMPPMTCEDGADPIQVINKDLCCYHLECRSCTGPDGKNKKSGDTWISNCQECFCDKNFTVKCSQIVCATTPEPVCSKEGFELIEVVTPSDTCCPKRECRCNPNLCRSSLYKCDAGFQLTVSFPSGACCATYSCVPKNVCVVDGIEYPVLSSVSSDASSCKTCRCTEQKDPRTKLNIIVCRTIDCPSDCQPGYRRVKNAGECCGTCTQVACVINNANGTLEVHQPGDTWTTPGLKCTSCRCQQIGKQFILVMEKTLCAPFIPENCKPGSIQMTPDGCCQTCQVIIEKACSLQTKSVQVSHNSCSGTIYVGYCSGLCMSSSIYVLEKEKMERKCSCCKEVAMTKKKVQLSCSYGTFHYSYITVAQCECVNTDCVT